jgi:hypothetical protein
LQQLLAAYLPELPQYRTVTVNAERVRFVLTNNLTNEGAFMVRVLCDSNDVIRGAVFATCDSFLLSMDKIARVLFIVFANGWNTPFNTEMLVDVYVKWARLRRAKSIQLLHATALDHHEFKLIGNLYEYEAEKKS